MAIASKHCKPVAAVASFAVVPFLAINDVHNTP
jgi:hypothetical protein